MKNLFVFSILFIAIFSSGCTESGDITNMFQSIPQVQEFLKEHPNARIVIIHLSEDEIKSTIDEISSNCGKKLPAVAMYKAIATADNLIITSWFDSANKQMVCSVIEGSATPDITGIPKDLQIPPQISILPITLPTSDAPGADFSEIPRYPEFIRINSLFKSVSGKNYSSITYFGKAKVKEVSEFYLKRMPEMSWTSWFKFEVSTKRGNGSILGFTKGNKSATILIVKDIEQEGTLIIISESPYPSIFSMPNIPKIVNFTPTSSLSDTWGTSRRFNITVDQVANIKWYDGYQQVQLNESVTYASFESTLVEKFGTKIILAIIENENGTAQQSWIWYASSIFSMPRMPKIVNFTPTSQLSDTLGTSRKFNVTVDQVANIKWYDGYQQVQLNESVTNASFERTLVEKFGTKIILAVVENQNGTAQQSWIWIVEPYAPSNFSMPRMPKIVNFTPTSQLSDTMGTSRKFNITVDQVANIKWYDGYQQVQFNESVTNASFESTLVEKFGTKIILAVVENQNGTAQQSWIWIVKSSN